MNQQRGEQLRMVSSLVLLAMIPVLAVLMVLLGGPQLWADSTGVPSPSTVEQLP
jgi:hypothetical protein